MKEVWKEVWNEAAIGFGGHHPVNNKLAKRRAARRHVMPGFPWDGKFETKEQVDAYFAGDKIQCLLCGRAMKNLACHLGRIHGMTCDAYRTKYGLRWWRGLSSDDLRTARSLARKAYAATHIDQLRETAALGREAMRKNPPIRRKKAPFVLREATKRATRMVKNKGKDFVWTDAHALEFLRRMETGRTIPEVSADADMPSNSWLSCYRQTHPEFDLKVCIAILTTKRGWRHDG